MSRCNECSCCQELPGCEREVDRLQKALDTAREDGARMRQMAIAARLVALAALHPNAAAVRAMADRLMMEAGR